MCENLTLPDGTYCTSVGELRKALYPKKITPYKDVGPLRDEDCLCSVDFQALADREGWTLEFDFGDRLAKKAEGLADGGEQGTAKP